MLGNITSLTSGAELFNIYLFALSEVSDALRSFTVVKEALDVVRLVFQIRAMRT